MTARQAARGELAKAHYYGVTACIMGKPRAVDQRTLDVIGAAHVGEPRTLAILQAFYDGYSVQVEVDLLDLLDDQPDQQ